MHATRLAARSALRIGDPAFEQALAAVLGQGRPGAGVLLTLRAPAGSAPLAARELASRLGRSLLRVDVSGAVSSYIGETEKNLARALARARAGAVILLFDEADALFGRRSTVTGAHDRYANQEVSYLLTQLDALGGIAILCTRARGAPPWSHLQRVQQLEVSWPPR